MFCRRVVRITAFLIAAVFCLGGLFTPGVRHRHHRGAHPHTHSHGHVHRHGNGPAHVHSHSHSHETHSHSESADDDTESTTHIHFRFFGIEFTLNDVTGDDEPAPDIELVQPSRSSKAGRIAICAPRIWNQLLKLVRATKTVLRADLAFTNHDPPPSQLEQNQLLQTGIDRSAPPVPPPRAV